MVTALAKQLVAQSSIALPLELWEAILSRAIAVPSYSAVHTALWPYLEAFSEKPAKWMRLRDNPKGMQGFVRSLCKDANLHQDRTPFEALLDRFELPTKIQWYVAELLCVSSLAEPEEEPTWYSDRLEDTLVRRARAVCDACTVALAKVHPDGPPPRLLQIWSNRKQARLATAVLIGTRLWLSAQPSGGGAELRPFEHGEVDEAVRASFAPSNPDVPAIRRFLQSAGVLLVRYPGTPAEQQQQHSRAPQMRLNVRLLRVATWRLTAGPAGWEAPREQSGACWWWPEESEGAMAEAQAALERASLLE